VQQEPLLYRDEATAAVFAILDMNRKLTRIIELLLEDDDGEEEAEEGTDT
jgi:hypothetical protein